MNVNELKVGEKLLMGSYTHNAQRYEPQEISWIKVSPNNDFISEFALDYLSFDAYEGYNVDNADFRTSNLAQFLNSDHERWFEPQTQTDVAPDWRDTKPGFLTNFLDFEVGSMEEAPAPDGVAYKVRVPTTNEIVGPNHVRFPYFKRHGIRPHPGATMRNRRVTGGHWFDSGSFVDFWLLDRYSPSSYRAKRIDRSGYVDDCPTSVLSGIRPVIRLKSDVQLDRVPTGYFVISPYAAGRAPLFTDEDIFALLGI